MIQLIITFYLFFFFYFTSDENNGYDKNAGLITSDIDFTITSERSTPSRA